MDWLIRQFGRKRLIESETILPLAEHFPAKYDASRDAVRALFDQVCEYIGIDGQKVELAYYSEGSGRHYGLGYGLNGTSAGLYDEREDRTIIWLETSNVNDPMSVVATFAHELCHMHLLGGKRVGRDELDHEPLTDLAVIFFGFGVFAANSSFSSRSYRVGNMEFNSMKRQGYLPPPVLGYGLALYAALREEMRPDWAQHVRADVRQPMREAIAYLESAGVKWPDDVDLGGENCPPLEMPELSQDLLERLGLPSVVSEEMHEAVRTDARKQQADEDFSPDDAFTEGHAALRARNYDEAARLFQKVIDHQPDDGEAYAQLALAQLRLNRGAEAVAAASKAIEINEDDAEAFQFRGSGCVLLKQYQDAVNDFTRSMAIDRAEKRKDRFAVTTHLLGQARARLGQHKQAIRDFSLAISEIPTWEAPYESRAEAYEQLGEKKKAAADRNEAARRREAL
jgi:tetratricopeptide (TPR) repeat protein